MLEVHKEYTIRGDPGKLDEFIAELSDHLTPGWSRDREREAGMERLSGARHYVFRRTARAGRPAISLFMVKTRGVLKVTNIVPQESGSLTRSQYNGALDEFAEPNARVVAERLGLEVSTTPDQRPITHWLSEEAAQRLQSFSWAANKGTGSSHPNDFQRWASFLTKVHREGWPLDSETLQRWLIEEEGWPQEKAIELATEFEFARGLLRAYDAER